MTMRRRDFVALAGAAGAAAAFPRAAFAQQSALPTIGWISGGNEQAFSVQLAAYRRALQDAGFVEGRNVLIEWRWTDGQTEKLLGFINDLVDKRVSVLSLSGGAQGTAIGSVTSALLASGIPAVAAFGRDPRKDGFVGNLGRPDSNFTGVNQQTQELEPKRLNLLRDVVPTAKTIAYLARPSSPVTAGVLQDAQDAARQLGLRLVVLNADTVGDIDSVFMSLARTTADGMIIGANPFFNTQRDQVTRLVTEARIPAIAEWREFAADGALLSCGTSLDATFHQLGAYTAAILGGAKVADLPIVQNNTYEFVINLRAAKALGLTVPASMLAAATDVIE